MYADPALDHKPALLEQRGGAYYSEAAAASSPRCSPDGARHYVDVRNNRSVAGLPDDAVVEVPATVDLAGAHRFPSHHSRRSCSACQAVTAYEVLTIRRPAPATAGSRCARCSPIRWYGSGTAPSAPRRLARGQPPAPAAVLRQVDAGDRRWLITSSVSTPATPRQKSSSPRRLAAC
jgi:hypothetical protein